MKSINKGCFRLKATKNQIEKILNLRLGDEDVRIEVAWELLEQNGYNPNIIVKARHWSFADVDEKENTVTFCFADNIDDLIEVMRKA